MPQDHTHKQFDVDLETIRSSVMAMGGLLERQLVRSLEALKSGDLELVSRIVQAEREVNAMQVDVDQKCSDIIARRQPAAKDLRAVLTVMQIMSDLERIGDETKKIALKAQQIHAVERLTLIRTHEVRHAFELAHQMLTMALDAYARLDLNAAAEVVSRDEQVDAEFHGILRHLISYMMEDPRTISAAIEIIFVAKSIERIGDHAKNIAEAVVHVVKGKDMRHATPAEMKREAGTD
jgi:phosphate transport system protein